MRVLLSFIPVSLMAGMALPDKVDTSLGALCKVCSSHYLW